MRKSVILTMAAFGSLNDFTTSANHELKRNREICVTSTWRFSEIALRRARTNLLEGMSSMDAVEAGINIMEDFDEEFTFVGQGGLPNALGKLELDAAIMDGKLRYGAVMGIQNIEHPISVARKLLEKCVHNILVGEGALNWALTQGFSRKEYIMNEKTQSAWNEWNSGQINANDQNDGESKLNDDDSHDTIGMICLDDYGDLCAGTSTSGWKFKIPGRVGDSPLVGSGLYCDNRAGAAVATGDGEEIMRSCLAFLVVELMRSGKSPQQACTMGIERLVEICGRNSVFPEEQKSSPDFSASETTKQHQMLTVGVVAMSPAGEVWPCTFRSDCRLQCNVTRWLQVGAASTLHSGNTHRGAAGFPVVCWRGSVVLKSEVNGSMESELHGGGRGEGVVVVEASLEGITF